MLVQKIVARMEMSQIGDDDVLENRVTAWYRPSGKAE
jgi:hypothetical protein